MKITKTTHILFIALIITIVFSGSLKNDFSWDDKYLIINNPYVKSWSYVPEIFKMQLYEGGQMNSNFYRPLQLLSFMVDYSIWKLNPFGYHLTSLLLHIFNSILVYLILISIMGGSSLALLAAILFGISPVISGISYYISARSDLLMALFMFLSLLFFIKHTKKKNNILYISSIILFILALLSKEMAVVLLMLLVLEIFRSGGQKLKKIRMLTPYIIIFAFYVLLRLTVLNFAQSSNAFIDFGYPATIPLWRRLLTDFKIIPKYLGLLLFPYGLHMDWFVEPSKTIFQLDVVFSIVILMLVTFIIRKISYRNNLALFGALWFLLTLLPVLNIYPISVFFGEGWLYIPSIGFFIILSVIFQDIIRPRIGKIGTSFLVIVSLLYCAFFTISYGRIWKDSIGVFENILKYEKDSPFIHLTYNNLGIAYYDQGDFEKSIECSKESILRKPKFSEAHNSLGVTYMAVGEPIKAIASFRKAASLRKDYISSYCNLAHLYSNMGLQNNAIRFSKEAIKIDPDSYEAHSSLGFIFSKKGDIDKAIECFKKAREIRKEAYEPYCCLGSLYMKKKRFKEALDEYHEGLKRGARDYAFYNEIAHAYIRNKRFKDAERAFKKSISLNSNQAEPYNNLGNLYSMFGLFEAAIDSYERAIEIEPGNKEVRKNLIKTKIEKKSNIKRDAQYGKAIHIDCNTDI